MDVNIFYACYFCTVLLGNITALEALVTDAHYYFMGEFVGVGLFVGDVVGV